MEDGNSGKIYAKSKGVSFWWN